MANLIVRNIDDEIVKALKARAGEHGVSAETEALFVTPVFFYCSSLFI